MNQIVLERKDDKAGIPLSKVLENDEDINFDYIFSNLDHVDLDD